MRRKRRLGGTAERMGVVEFLQECGGSYIINEFFFFGGGGVACVGVFLNCV